jgi:hypothetical protein
MITDRDLEVFKFINRYGKSYLEVLGQTFYPTIQSARNRMNLLNKQGLITYWNTGLMSPRRAIILTEETKQFLYDEHDTKPKNAKLNTSTIIHNTIEQLADYYITQLQNATVERTTVYEHGSKLNHVPDLIYHHPKGKIYVEIETSKKSQSRYKDIFEAMQKDNILLVLYITKNEKTLKSYATTFPRWSKLRFLTIDDLITNVKTNKMLEPMSQEDIIKLG